MLNRYISSDFEERSLCLLDMVSDLLFSLAALLPSLVVVVVSVPELTMSLTLTFWAKDSVRGGGAGGVAEMSGTVRAGWSILGSVWRSFVRLDCIVSKVVNR